MECVRLTGWREGLQKIALSRLIREKSGLGLAEAKEFTDRLLEGEEVVVRCISANDAGELERQAADLGAICSRERG